MSSPRVALWCLAAIIMSGCDRAPTAPAGRMTPIPTATRDDAPDATADAPLSGPMQSVTGFYERVSLTIFNNFKYSFSAIRHADGSVSGEIEERTTYDPTGAFLRSMHGTVTCFTIVGNMAFLAGFVDRVDSDVPGQEGLVPGAFFRLNVVDNGNGDDPPDLGSNIRFGDPRIQPRFCDNLVPFNLEPIQHGNITIRP